MRRLFLLPPPRVRAPPVFTRGSISTSAVTATVGKAPVDYLLLPFIPATFRFSEQVGMDAALAVWL